MKRLFTLLIVLCISSLAYAQSEVRTRGSGGGQDQPQAETGKKRVNGRIVDANGEPLVGATVTIINATTKQIIVGGIADANGEFNLEVSASGSQLLRIGYVGYKIQEVSIDAQSQGMNISMQEDVLNLDEVVVTALGGTIDRDKYGTSSTNIKGQSLVQSGEISVGNALAGKVSGLTVIRSGGDPGAGIYLQIRGQSSINGLVQPLIVVDGIPIDNSNFDQGVAGTTQQSRLNDINPDDIESTEVLKSAAAAALWGSRGANGVIYITTKRAKSTGNKLNVVYRTTVSIDNVNKLPGLQTRFGQGINQRFTFNSATAYGDIIANRAGGNDVFTSGPSLPGTDYVVFPDGSFRGRVASGTNSTTASAGGKRSTATNDHGNEVFRTGVLWENSLQLSGGNERYNFLFSYGNVNQNGIIRNGSDYYRNSFRVNAGARVTDKFKLSLNANYVNNTSNRAQQGSNLNGIFLGGLRTPPDFDNSQYVGNYVSSSGAVTLDRNVAYRNTIGQNADPVYDNPFWTINRNWSRSETNRFLGSVQADWDPISWLNVMLRSGLDAYYEKKQDYYHPRSAASGGGIYNTQTYFVAETTTDLMVKLHKQFSNNFNGHFMVGYQYNNRSLDNTGVFSNSFISPEAPPNPTNVPKANLNPFQALSFINRQAVYSEVYAELFDQLYLTGTMRAERDSRVPKTTAIYYYPSITAAWNFTKASFFPQQDILSFGKLRASYGVVGVISFGAYSGSTVFVATGAGDGFGPVLNAGGFPPPGLPNAGAALAIQQGATAGNPDVKPEFKYEFEVGTDLRFWKDRISVGLTYYNNRTDGIVLPITVPSSTGFTNQVKNAAKITNWGIEADLGAEWLRLGKFSWFTNVNYSMYRNKVTDLGGVTSFSLGGGGFTGSESAVVLNQPVGVFFGTDFIRNAEGGLVLDANGFPQLDQSGNKVIGNPNPDFRMGIGNTFRYGNLSLYVLFDWVKGNQVWNGTKGALFEFGTTSGSDALTNLTGAQATALRRANGSTVASGYTANGDGTYTVRGYVTNFGGPDVFIDQNWWTGRSGSGNALGSGFSGPASQFIEDGSSLRLREVTLAYSLTSAGFRKASRLQSVEFSVTGRNLALWTKYSGIDPETNLTGAATNARGLDYFNNPNTRSLIFTIKVSY